VKPKLILLIVFLASLILLLSCSESEDREAIHEGMETDQIESSLIRDFDVKVASLDENYDGKVFQCPMDWQVISDDAGSCPLCNMKLKEYSVADAQKNLE
jgi:hypothetical protein